MKAIRVLRNNKQYVIAMFLLFIIGVILGDLLKKPLHTFMQPQLEHLKTIADEIKYKNSPVYTTIRIFFNNFEVGAIYVPLLGIFLGLFPMFMILTNGLLVGYLLGGISSEFHYSAFRVFLVGILPHGILEIPAFVFSAALATKLGFVIMRPIHGLSRGESIGYVVKEYIPVLIFVVALLAVAACIEGLVTPVLMHTFLVKR